MRTALIATCLALLAFAGCSEDDERPPLIPDAEGVGFLQPPRGPTRGGVVGEGGSASSAGSAGMGGMSGAGSGLGGAETMGNSDGGVSDAGTRGDAGP